MDNEHMTGKYIPVPRQPLKPNENTSLDTRISPGQGMKPGYTGYIPGKSHSKYCNLQSASGLILQPLYKKLRIPLYICKDIW